MNPTFAVLSTLCFLGGFFYSAAMLRAGKHRISGINLAIMGLGFVFQCVFLYQVGQIRGRCPITNVFDVLIFVSWAMVLFYLILGPPFRVSLFGAFTAPLVFVFQVVALLLPEAMKASEKALPGSIDPWLEAHAAISLLAYGAFATAFVAGVMYLVQDWQLKKHRLQTLFYNLPPIQLLGKSIFRLVGIGILLLTVGIGAAFFMEQRPSGLHLWMTLAVWAVYAAIFLSQVLRGGGSRRMAMNAVWGFAGPILTLAVLSSS